MEDPEADSAEALTSVFQPLPGLENPVEDHHRRADHAEPDRRDGGRIAKVESVPIEGALVDVCRNGLRGPERAAGGHDPDKVKDLHLAYEGEDVKVQEG